MKLLTAALVGASLIGGTMAASAQGIGVDVGPGGVYVGAHDGYREGYREGRFRRDRDWRNSRAYYRGDRDETVIVKKKRIRPDGTVVITRDRY